MEFDQYGIICPHNDACRCQVADCDYCGWNPVVTEQRLEKLAQANQDDVKKHREIFLRSGRAKA